MQDDFNILSQLNLSKSKYIILQRHWDQCNRSRPASRGKTSFGSIWLHFWDSWSCRLRSWGSRQLGITGAAESKSMDIMEPCWTVNHGKSISVTQTMVFTCFYIAGQWLPLLLASDCGFGRSASGHRGENVTKSPQLQSHRLSKAEIQFTTDFEEREIDKLCPKLYVTLCHYDSVFECTH